MQGAERHVLIFHSGRQVSALFDVARVSASASFGAEDSAPTRTRRHYHLQPSADSSNSLEYQDDPPNRH
jgi:hypothetical protein